MLFVLIQFEFQMLINKKDLIIRTLALDKILRVHRLSGNVDMNCFITL